MYLIKLTLSIIYFSDTVIAANLRSCSLENEQPSVCFLGERYVDPFEKFPVVIESGGLWNYETRSTGI